MIEHLRSVGDQLRAAWNNYYQVCATLQNYGAEMNASYISSFPLDVRHQLDTELAFISSYELKILELKATISRARNYSSGIAPINALPAEVLRCIFYMVVAQPCLSQLTISPNGRRYPIYPECLGEVCALWRGITLSFHTLWRHIDLSPRKSNPEGYIARAEAHITRSGEQPLELHIIGEGDRSSQHEIIYQFLSRIANRVESLEFTNVGGFGGIGRGVLKQLIQQHPALIKLIIRSGGSCFDRFITTNSVDSYWPQGYRRLLPSNVTEDQFNNFFASLTVLHLRGVFPLWSSTAYHGLVDLRLLSTDLWSHITRTELIAILASSPGLRILHFGLEIQEIAQSPDEVLPVDLKDLEVVKIFTENSANRVLCPSKVLRLLAPGIKPLRLLLAGYHVLDTTLATELDNFFTRSRVAKFYTWAVFPSISLLLCHSAHLEVVVLDEFESHPQDAVLSKWLEVGRFALLPRLKSLHIVRSILPEASLRLLLECCPDGTSLYSCRVNHDQAYGYRAYDPEELLDAFPTVRITDYIPHPSKAPTADWDILD